MADHVRRLHPEEMLAEKRQDLVASVGIALVR